MDASTNASYPIVAYTERDSIDPLTCEEGKLRREWAVISANPLPHDLAHLRADCPARARDWSDYVLISRYVRRGKVEPWSVMEYFDSEIEALEDVEPGVVAVDLRLVTIHREREHAQRVEEAKRAAESEKVQARERTRQQEAAGAKAFRKLWEKGEGTYQRALCERWTAFVSSPLNIDRRDLYAADPAFMSLYYAALYANRLPSKRKAMREFFAYVEAHYPDAGGANDAREEG